MQIIDKLRTSGFTKLGVYNVDELALEVESRFETLGDTSPSINLPRDGTGDLAPLILKALDNVRPTMESHFGSYFQPYWVSIQQNHPGPVSVESSFGWHIDDTPNPMMKVFIYLNDVTRKNGAFRTFDINDSKQLFQMGLKSWKPKQRVKNSKLVNDYLKKHPDSIHVLEGESGTILMFDSNLVHKGTAPEVGHRSLIQIQVYPSMNPFNTEELRLSLTRPITRDYPARPWINDMIQ